MTTEKKNTIEIENYHPINKGSLQASCTVYLTTWHLKLHEVKIFNDGQRSWVNLPSKVTETATGKRYDDMVEFDSKAIQHRFKSQLMDVIEQFLIDNPDAGNEPVVPETEDLPF